MSISTNYTFGDLRTLKLPELLNITVFYNFMKESFHHLSETVAETMTHLVKTTIYKKKKKQTWIKVNEF